MAALVLLGRAALLYTESYEKTTGQTIKSAEDLASITTKIHAHLDSCLLCKILQATTKERRSIRPNKR